MLHLIPMAPLFMLCTISLKNTSQIFKKVKQSQIYFQATRKLPQWKTRSGMSEMRGTIEHQVCCVVVGKTTTYGEGVNAYGATTTLPLSLTKTHLTTHGERKR